MGFSKLAKKTVLYTLAIWLVFFFLSIMGINIVPESFFMSNIFFIVMGYLAINIAMVKY